MCNFYGTCTNRFSMKVCFGHCNFLCICEFPKVVKPKTAYILNGILFAFSAFYHLDSARWHQLSSSSSCDFLCDTHAIRNHTSEVQSNKLGYLPFLVCIALVAYFTREELPSCTCLLFLGNDPTCNLSNILYSLLNCPQYRNFITAKILQRDQLR